MKKRLLTAAFFVGAWGAYSQVGIGTLTPNNASQLDVVAKDKGVLLPRVALTSTTDTTTIINGNVNSLLVFNTNTQNDITPGYYYWYDNKWMRIINDDDVKAFDTNTTNVSLTVVTDELVLKDSDGNEITVSLSDLNIITTLVNNNDGTYTYTNEAGVPVIIDVPADVINNVEQILGDTNVLNELIEVLGDTYVGGNVYYDGTQFTYVDQSGATHIINFEDIVQANETVTTLVNNNDGTYTYTNEAGVPVIIDVPADVINNVEQILGDTNVLNELIEVLGDTYVGGNVYYDGTQFTYVDQSGATHIINFEDIVQANETVTTLVNNNDGTYTYTNEAGVPVIIDVPADVMNNIEQILGDTNVLNELIEVLGDTYVGGNVYYDGTQFTYVDQSGATHIINFEDIVQANETVTTLVNNNDGTYTYTSEDDTPTIINVPASVIENFENIYNQIVNEEITVDGNHYNTFEEYLTTIINNNTNFEDNDFITVTGSGTDADPYKIEIKEGANNSMLITNAAGELEWATIESIVKTNETVTRIEEADGIYTYYNEDNTPFVIDIPASVIENFENIYNNIVNEEITVDGNHYNTFEEYLTTIINNNTNFEDNDFITVTGSGTDADPFKIEIKEGANNSMLITNAAGELEWATIESIVKANETVTRIEEADGIYTYYNEENAPFIIDIPASVVENFENIYNQIVNEEITVDGNHYNTFEEYLTTIINNNTNFEDNDFITVTGSGTDADPFKIEIKEGANNSMLITNAAGELEWATIESIVQANETVTTVTDNADGTYTYINEAGTPFEISIPASIVESFETIVNSGPVVVGGETYNTIEEYIEYIANASVTVEGSDFITVTGDGTSGNPYKVEIKEGAANSMLITNAAGELEWATIESIVQANETVTVLVKNADGTYTYYNENEIDADGTPSAGATGVTIDPKEVSVALNTTTNIYEFKNSAGDVIGSIDMNADNVAFDNTNNDFTSDDVQGALEELFDKIKNAKGDLVVAGGLEFTGGTTGIAKLLADANIQIADGGVTTDKLDDKAVTADKLDGGQGAADRVGVADADGNITYKTLDEVVKANETVTVLIKNADGTYTYYNENEIDADGTPSAGATGVTIDPKEVSVALNTTTNIYEFKNSAGDVIGSIDMNADNVAFDNTNNDFTSDDVQGALEELFDKIENAKGDLVVAGGLEFTGGTTGIAKLLADANIQIADGGVTTDKLDDKAVTADKLDGGQGAADRVGVADADGNITYKTLDEVVKANETVTVLVKNADGTYTYYNENEIDADGTPSAGATGVTIDPKEVSVALNTTTNIYEFKNSAGDVIGSIDMNADNVAFDNTNNDFTSDDVQGALEELFDKIENAKGDLVVAGGLEFTGGTTGIAKLLADANIQIADGGVTTDKLDDKAVTADKIAGGRDGEILVTDGDNGVVKWVSKEEATSNTLALDGNKLTSTVNGVEAFVELTDANVTSTKGITGTGITVDGGAGATLKDVTLTLTPGAADQVMITKNDVATWVDQSEIVPETTNELESSGNTLTSTVNGEEATADIINSVANSLNDDNELVTTVNGVAGDGLDLTPAIQANQKTVTVVNGTNTTVTSNGAGTTGNNTEYQVHVSDAAIQEAVTLAGDVTGKAGETNLAAIQGTPVIANGTKTTGQALVFDGTNWVPGKPLVDATDVLNAKDLTAADADDATIEVATGGTAAVLVETSLRVKAESITTGHIQDGTIAPVDIADAGANQVLVTGADNKPVWKDQNKVAPQFFYMPAVIFDTQATGTATRDLYQEYVNQFTGGAVGAGNATYPISHGPTGTTPVQYTGGIVGSTGAPADIAVLDKGDLYYYVTYYDEAVFENLSIDVDGKLTYTVKAGATPSSYMNIVFVIK